jgi:H+/Cl- antiporter ClcA
MNPAGLQQKLIAAARAAKPDDRVPYAFEQRILALVGERARVDHWAGWSRGLWRAAISSVAMTLLFGALSLLTPVAPDNGKDLSQDFENTLLASVDQGDTAP